MGKKKSFYAVVRGRQPGLYKSWESCEKQIRGFSDNLFKGFVSENEAVDYLNVHGNAPPVVSARERERSPARASTRTHFTVSPHGEGLEAGVDEKSEAGACGKDASEHKESSGGSVLVEPNCVARLEFDGASKSNPGPSGFGAVLFEDSSDVVLAKVIGYVGDMKTNNQAEYSGLIAGLQEAKRLGITRIKVIGDSKLVVNQVLGKWAIRNEGLKPLHRAAKELAKSFESFEAQQVPRAQNTIADAASNEAIEKWRDGTLKSVWSLNESQL
eukprot:jgi/Picsp_1/3062/NSC_01284-R1_ribonuclease h